jgi:hypothetical protein
VNDLQTSVFPSSGADAGMTARGPDDVELVDYHR